MIGGCKRLKSFLSLEISGLKGFKGVFIQRKYAL